MWRLRPNGGLPTVARLDDVIRSGAARSRAEIVESALERELRRRVGERDAVIYRPSDPDEDLDGLNEWMQSGRAFSGLR